MPINNALLKKLLFILLFSIPHFCAFAQTDTANTTKTADTASKAPPITVKTVKRPRITDTFKKRLIADSLKKDDSLAKSDSILQAFSDTAKASAADTVKKPGKAATIKKPVDSIYLKLLDNPFTKTEARPIYLVINEKKEIRKMKFFI